MKDFLRMLFVGEGAAFVWSEHVREIVITALLSIVPAFEGRYALVVAQGMGMPPVPAYFMALIFSTIPMLPIILLLRPILDAMYKMNIGFLRRFAEWVDKRAEKKAASVDKKGLLGLYIFVAVPLPGTGVWTGSAVAAALKMNVRHACVAIFLGNATACLIMTILTYLGITLFG